MTTKDFPKLESLNKENELGRSYNIDKITDKIYLGGIKGLLENFENGIFIYKIMD